MYTREEAEAKIEAGEHVVEVAITYMDGVFESFYPSPDRGWNASMRDPDLFDSVLIKFVGGYLCIPLTNVRYYECIVHNPPARDETRRITLDVPEGFEICLQGGIPHFHRTDEMTCTTETRNPGQYL